MLKFINDNPVLFSCLCTVFGAVLSAVVSLVISNRKNKNETIQGLRKELDTVRKELSKYQTIEEQEKNIDKTTGAIYEETMPDGTKRSICGYCWEKDHTKMPLIISKYRSEEERRIVTVGTCGHCKASCYDK